jgi:hypothetical protein
VEQVLRSLLLNLRIQNVDNGVDNGRNDNFADFDSSAMCVLMEDKIFSITKPPSAIYL